MKKVACIGQAPPLKQYEKPFGGTILYKWFDSINISDDVIKDQFLFSALINYSPGYKGKGHAAPTPLQIQECRPILKEELRNFNPEIIVPIGKLAIQEALQEKIGPLHNYIGKMFTQDAFNFFGKELLIIPLPHPSGASTWHHRVENKRLLQKSLELLKKTLTF